MSDVTAKLIWQQEGLKFTGINSNGLETVLDGDKTSGASPMDLLLEAVAGCTSIDIVMILQKMREPLARLEVSLAGERHSPEPRYYTAIRASFDLWGDGLNTEKVERSIKLSFEKYCSVFHSLRADLQLTAEYRINAAMADAAGEFQTVEITRS